MHHAHAPERADPKMVKVAMLIALACVLQISESMIPHPIPGLRLGLANMLTLTALVMLGFGYALEVAVLRTVLSSFIMGTFMSPTFLLSLGGAVVSTLVMGFFYWLSGLSTVCRLSIIGISIVGAFVHNLVQLVLAYLLLVKHPGIFIFFPWLSIGAVATGWVVGVVTGGVCLRLQSMETTTLPTVIPTPSNQPAPQPRNFSSGRSWLHRRPAEVKLIVLLAMAVGLLVFPTYGFSVACFVLLCIMLPCSHTPATYFLKTARRYWVLLLISFLMPVFFNAGTQVIFTMAGFQLTTEGLNTGTLFTARILLLIMGSALMIRTTAPEDIIGGLVRLLRPMQSIGLSCQRTATLLSLSWMALPRIWTTARNTIASVNMKDVKQLNGLLPLMSDLIANLYMQTEPAHGSLDRSSAKKEGDTGGPCVPQ